MYIGDVYSEDQICSLVAKLTETKGPYAAKDWIIRYIKPGILQAKAMSTMFNAMNRKIA